MCTGDGQSAGNSPGSVAEALRGIDAGLDYLNSPAAREVAAAAVGEVLTSLGMLHGKLAAAQAAFLAMFDAADGHDADGYGSSSAWLAAKAGMTKRDARAAVRQMRQFGERARLADALAAGEISQSWAAEIAGWTRKLPAELRDETDKILLEAAAAGASLEGLAVIAAAAIEKWRSQQPDPDLDPMDFKDRYLQVGVTFGGAAVIRGDLTPECGAAVRAVVEALGKRHGAEDDRTEKQRFHDALQEACEILIRARMVPARAGADTQVIVHTTLSQLRAMPGASELEQAWLNAILGEPGYLVGKDAEVAACDAMTVPVVVGHADMTVVDRIIELALAAYDGDWTGEDFDDLEILDDGNRDAGGSGGSGSGNGGIGNGLGDHDGRPGGATSRPAPTREERNLIRTRARARERAMTPDARQALRYAIARLAIDFLSGPNGLAAFLRTSLFSEPYNTPSLPLDIGYADSIPASIRRAVMLRDKRCAWPRCGRAAVYCDVHHLRHKEDGGATSVSNCILLCQFHHDVCIHRWGWELTLHPDGTTTAYGPRGQVLHSHAPPALRAG